MRQIPLFKENLPSGDCSYNSCTVILGMARYSDIFSLPPKTSLPHMSGQPTSLKSRKLKATDIPTPALELDFAALIGQPGCMDDWGSLVAKSQAKRLLIG